MTQDDHVLARGARSHEHPRGTSRLGGAESGLWHTKCGGVVSASGPRRYRARSKLFYRDCETFGCAYAFSTLPAGKGQQPGRRRLILRADHGRGPPVSAGAETEEPGTGGPAGDAGASVSGSRLHAATPIRPVLPMSRPPCRFDELGRTVGPRGDVEEPHTSPVVPGCRRRCCARPRPCPPAVPACRTTGVGGPSHGMADPTISLTPSRTRTFSATRPSSSDTARPGSRSAGSPASRS